MAQLGKKRGGTPAQVGERCPPAGKLAATYSPTGLPQQYHPRGRA
jgi:hypothetical protein